MSEIKTFDECCKDVAKKNGFGDLVTGHLKKYYSEAAEIYASQYKAKIQELESDVKQWEFISKGLKAKVEELEMIVSARDQAVNRLTKINASRFDELTSLKQEKERLCSGYIDCIQMLSDACGYLFKGNEPEGIKLINAANKKLLSLHPNQNK